MKHTTRRKSVHLQYMWLFMFLYLLAAMTSAQGSGKSKKDLLNEDYRKIEKKMKESYDNKEFKNVIHLFKKECCKDNGGYYKLESKSKARAFREKKRFKKVSKEIRANIYQWVAFSYLELRYDQVSWTDKIEMGEMGDIYLRKLCNVSETQLNETFRDIAKEIKEHFDNGKLKQVIYLYKKYSGSDDKAKAKPGKEIKGFKKVQKKTRSGIYRWTALSYDALDRPNIRDIYLKKILDIKLDLGIGDYWSSIRNWVEKKYVVAPKWLLGLKYGINFTFIEPVDNFNFTDSRGSQPGFILEYALKKNLSVSIQPAYINLGFLYEKSSHKLYYAEIPALLKYQFLKGKLRPYLQIGLFYHYLMAANKGIDDSPGEDIKDKIHRSNWGFWVGAGIGPDIKFGDFSLRPGIEVNYKHGFRNIVNENDDDPDNIKLRNFAISVKLLFSIYRKAFRK